MSSPLVRWTLSFSILAIMTAPLAQAKECALSPEATVGAAVAKTCKGCHVFDGDKKSRPTGPNLARVYGREAGTSEDFRRYSQGMKLTADKGVTWTEANLDAYLTNPKAFLEKASGRRGVRHGMFYFLPDATKRRQVIAYLKDIKACYD